MIAYGAARYALARGDAAEAAEVWPLVEWCLEYCRRRLTGDGVVASDSDELEGRFPAGDANLCTSSLYYDALLSAAMLGRELHKPPGSWPPTNVRPPRCGKTSTAISGAWSRASTPIVIIRATTVCVRGSAFR